MKLLLAFSALLAVVVEQCAACSCGYRENATLVQRYVGTDGLFFRAKVIKQVPLIARVDFTMIGREQGNSTDPSLRLPIGEQFGGVEVQYVVQVGRVFSGCTIQPSERILVRGTTGWCGIESLTVNATYALSSWAGRPINALTKAILGNRTKVQQEVELHHCAFISPLQAIDSDTMAELRAHKK